MTERSVSGVVGSLSSSVGGGMHRCTARGMDKRKVCVFLILVAVGLLCLLLMAYMLFYANPRANSTIQNDGHSALRLDKGAAVRS